MTVLNLSAVPACLDDDQAPGRCTPAGFLDQPPPGLGIQMR
jgi:hypothetical protein